MLRGIDAEARNRHPLDWLNLLLADVQDGLGPFLAVYLLAGRHWEPARIGLVMSVGGIATVLARTPAGLLVDRITAKRGALIAAAISVGLGSAAMAVWPHFWAVVAAQLGIGAVDAAFPPLIAAISLGIVGERAFTRRIGRNESFNHAGNVVTALLAGLAGYFVAQVAVLWIVALLALASAVAALWIRPGDIDHRVARGGGEAASGDLRALFRDRRLLFFTASITLFHFANAAMLPLLGERLAGSNPQAGSLFVGACVITAQAVMVPVAWLAGRQADAWGRKPIFLVGFAVLPLRGVLYTLVHGTALPIAIQALDGVGAGIFSVLFLVVVEDCTRGTGRFSLALGASAAAWGFGAALSNGVAGLIVRSAGFDAAFLTLAGIAAAALLLFWLGVPETRPARA
jgi:MFS family permease